ncbi:MAG: hypothetical protein LBR10_08225, partial [Prevotellaceae bacterium]|nr:hypothetical protein [Prevotellaceae bacterium]
KEFAAIAHRAEANRQIADALRYYYWALMLLQSHPDAGSMTAEADGGTQKLDVYLPNRINAIFADIAFAVSGREADENLTRYTLRVTCRGQPAANCDYSFFDGRSWSLPVSAKDGLGIAEMFGNSALHREIRVKTEYAFENEWNIDSEVKDVLGKVEPVILPKSYITVSLDEAKQPAANAATALSAGGKTAAVADKVDTPETSVESTGVMSAIKTVQVADGTPYLPMLERVENAIRTKNYASARDCFTDEGYDIFTKLVQYGRGVILVKPEYSFMKFEDGIMARSMSMRFSFSGNRRTFVEDVVFDISQSEGKIRSLSFALSGKVCEEILKHEQWGEYSRVAIIQFIENYKTAYALKRLDYIESVFSNNALIIVGKIVKAYAGENMVTTNQVKLTQFSKEKYIRHLTTVFGSNEYVNLKFTDISVKKAGVGGEIYGIQLKQDYFSTNYGDTGYLFLMVNLNKTNEPVIHIRTWQPEKDPNFGVYDISHF